MRKIVAVDHIEKKKDSLGEPYFRTHALLDDGEEVVGFGNDFEIGDLVERFYDPIWDVIKMRKTPAQSIKQKDTK